MNNMIKRETGQQPATFGTVVDQIFQDNLNRFFDDEFWGINGKPNRSQVPVNIRESENSYEMELIAPGLRKQDFRLNISGDTLTVSFEHSEENNSEDADGKWLKREYKKQAFARSFNLDDTVDAGSIRARYEDGILRLQIPKKENAKTLSRSITIQ